jgi:hypothetical protein
VCAGANSPSQHCSSPLPHDRGLADCRLADAEIAHRHARPVDAPRVAPRIAAQRIADARAADTELAELGYRDRAAECCGDRDIVGDRLPALACDPRDQCRLPLLYRRVERRTMIR